MQRWKSLYRSHRRCRFGLMKEWRTGRCRLNNSWTTDRLQQNGALYVTLNSARENKRMSKTPRFNLAVPTSIASFGMTFPRVKSVRICEEKDDFRFFVRRISTRQRSFVLFNRPSSFLSIFELEICQPSAKSTSRFIKRLKKGWEGTNLLSFEYHVKMWLCMWWQLWIWMRVLMRV